MIFSRLTFVTITALILHNGCCPAIGAQAQTVRAVSAPGAKRQPAVASGPAAAGTNVDSLPDAPGIASQQNGQSAPASLGVKGDAAANQAPVGRKQTKRILYVIPNFRSVSANETLPPQTVKEKFTTATLDSVDYSSFIFVAVQAGVAQARKSTPEFRQGTAGYGRYYWHTYADYVDENLWVEFLLPTVLHQDSRYYTLGSGGFAKRLGYSLSRPVVTRTDSGHETFNASEIFGAGAAAGISTLYYPSQERTFTKTYEVWLTSIAIDAGSNLFKEFWPDINHNVFHQKD